MAYDIPSISDLEAVQLLNKHYAEVITSKEGGVSSAADITQTTNPITGVTRRTLYKILDDAQAEHDAQMQSFESDFDSRLADMAFTRVGTFTSGATLTDMRQTLLWEVSQGGDGHEYGWTGSFLPSGKVVAAGSTPATTGGIGAGAWVDRTDVTLRDEIRETVFQNMKRLYAEAGFNLVYGSFQMGGSLSGWPDVLWDWSTGVAYQWHLDEAITVAAGSTPETAGGIGVNAWVDRTDVHSGVEERLLGVGAKIYRGSNGQYVQNGDTVPVGTTHLAVLINGKVENLIVWNSPTLPAVITNVPASDNGYAGYDLVTDQGTFELTSENIKELRNKYLVTGYGATPNVNDNTTREINRIAIEKMMVQTGGLAKFPLGEFFVNPISQSIIETYVKPSFIGETNTLFTNDNVVTIINTNNQDFYYNGSQLDYSYYVKDLIFVGGGDFTARIFGSDVTDGSNREHRGTFQNVAFHQCLKGLYTEDYSSSTYMNQVVFRRCIYGHCSKLGGNNSKYHRCRFDFCQKGLYTRGFNIHIDSCHIALGTVDGFTERQKGISVAGYVTMSEIYIEPYGANVSNAVPYELRVYDPLRNNIIMNNCQFPIGITDYDIDTAMEYNNAVWSWAEDWLAISKVSNNKLPRFNMVNNAMGTLNTRLLQGISVGNNDGLSVNTTTRTAFFNKRNLNVAIIGANTASLVSYSSWGITMNQLYYPDTHILYKDLFVNNSDANSDGALHDGNVVRFGYAGFYDISLDIYIECPSLTVGNEVAIVTRVRDASAYKNRIIQTGKVLSNNGTPVINIAAKANLETNGRVGFYWGFQTDNGYVCPLASEIQSSSTIIKFSIKKTGV